MMDLFIMTSFDSFNAQFNFFGIEKISKEALRKRVWRIDTDYRDEEKGVKDIDQSN